MLGQFKTGIKRVDQLSSELYLKHRREKNALLAFFFHGLFKDDGEMSSGQVAPLEGTTIHRFRRFVEYYLGQGYTFVSADDIARGLDPSGKFVWITFDDGYANNQLALPVMQEYAVPATFFIATAPVLNNHSFWWDVLHRERSRRGVPAREIAREGRLLKNKPYAEIETYLTNSFGAGAFRPVGDLDRPMSRAELEQFSKNRCVNLGNHTHDHAILTNCSPDQIRQQIAEAQSVLSAILGKAPIAIAYPNGRWSKTVAQIARECGLRLGVTIAPEKNHLPIDPCSERAMSVSRFHLTREREINKDCELLRSDILFYPRLRYWLQGTRE